MPERPLIEEVSVRERVEFHTENSDSQVDIPALNALAVRSLAALFEEKEKLFARCITLKADGFHREGTSRKRTLIALLGLRRLAESGEAPPFDIVSIRDVILGDTSWVRGIGDLGLLTWFTAEYAPERLGRLLDHVEFGKALDSYADGRQACTRALAWLLAGIAHARLACSGMVPEMTDIAVDTYRLLQNNQSEGGIFGHASFPGLLHRTFCNRFGTFTDQIYAIYALTAFARAFQIEEPLEPALRCAISLRALQGQMGQWWFLYDKRACRVVNRYPVFAIQQDGIAPVGLLALGEATGQSFHESIYKGLSWLAGANELGNDLRSLDRGLIWDSIGPKRRTTNYWEAALSFMNISSGSRVENLGIRFEARPDHFGWLLYAFGSLGLPSAIKAG